MTAQCCAAKADARGPSLWPPAGVFSARATSFGRIYMNKMRILVAGAFATAIAVTTVSAQQPQTQRVRGTIEMVVGTTLLIKSPTGAPVTLTLAANAVVVGVLKATVADIKEGSY